jgi:transposase InsO family protein
MKALFIASLDSLGSRMMMNNLRDEGLAIGRDKTRRLMKALKLKVKQRRKFKVTTDSKHNFPVAPDVLNWGFSPSALNQAWGTDITYLWTQEGWIYLAVDAEERWTKVVSNLENSHNYALSDEIETARDALKGIIGEVMLVEEGPHVITYPKLSSNMGYNSGAQKRT